MQSTFTVKLKFKRFLCHVLDLSSIDQSGISVSTTFIVWRTHIPKHQIDHYSTVRLQRGNLCIFSTGFLFDTKKSSSVCIHCPWFYPQFIDHQASEKIFLFAGNTAPGLFKMIENSNDFYVWRNLLPVLWKRGKQSKYLWHYKQIFFIFRLWLKANISQVGLIKKSPKELSALETLKRWWWHWLHYTSSRNSQKNQKIKSPFWKS